MTGPLTPLRLPILPEVRLIAHGIVDEADISRRQPSHDTLEKVRQLPLANMPESELVRELLTRLVKDGTIRYSFTTPANALARAQ